MTHSSNDRYAVLLRPRMIPLPSTSGRYFSVWPFCLHFTATDALVFSHGSASNVLRGAFGHIFRKMACAPHCSDAKSCSSASECVYARLFEPKQSWAGIPGPSGLGDWPRPFAIRAANLDGHRIPAG